MGNFAKVEDGLVVNVIVAEKDFIDTLKDKDSWIETFHMIDNQIPQRKNFASIGFTYDAERDAFIPPKPFNSWTLNEETCLWSPPVELPSDGNSYIWNEEILNWELVPK